MKTLNYLLRFAKNNDEETQKKIKAGKLVKFIFVFLMITSLSSCMVAFRVPPPPPPPIGFVHGGGYHGGYEHHGGHWHGDYGHNEPHWGHH